MFWILEHVKNTNIMHYLRKKCQFKLILFHSDKNKSYTERPLINGTWKNRKLMRKYYDLTILAYIQKLILITGW